MYKLIASYTSQFGDYDVLDWEYEGTPARLLATRHMTLQSGMSLHKRHEPLFNYIRRFFDIFRTLPGDPAILLIGGGVYTFPLYAAHDRATAQIDVVEIDPVMDQIAADHFGYVPSKPIRIWHEDGRAYLERCKARYIAIFIDAYTPVSAAGNLSTRGGVARMHTLLQTDGLVVVNIMGRYDRGDNAYLRSLVATYETVFDHVQLFIADPSQPVEVQHNFVLVATSDYAALLRATRGLPMGPLPIALDGEVIEDAA